MRPLFSGKDSANSPPVLTTTEITIFAGTALLAAVLPMFARLPLLLRALGSSYLALELAFFIYGKYRYYALNRPITRYPDAARARLAMQRFLHLHSVFQLHEFLSGWFMGAPADSIPRGNIVEFVAYGFFCQPLEDLDREDRQAVEQFVSGVENSWKVVFESGYDGSLQFMAHVNEPLRVQHKPLGMYACTELAARTAHLLLRLMGFTKRRQGPFVCWTSRGHLAAAPDADPLSPPAAVAVSSLGGAQALDTPEGHFATHTTTMQRTHGSHSHLRISEVAHAAAEHALEAVVDVTSAAAAAASQQYPHDGQQYHLAAPRQRRGAVPRDSVTSVEMEPNAPNTDVPASNTPDFPPGGVVETATFEAPFTAGAEDKIAGENEPSPTPPLVFIHGVGFGVLPYLHFIRDLMRACAGSPVVVLEVPHVALRLCREAEGVDEVAAAAVAAVHALGARRASFVGHSYGTLCVSRIVQLYPDAVHSVTLLDPVCLLTCYPQLLHNFIYRTLEGMDLRSVNDWVDAARFLCSRDLTIAQAFCRKFHWTELQLWPEDLPRRELHALVVLAGKDDLVPGELVKQQFESAGHPAKVLLHPQLGHGGLLLDPKWMAEVVESISALVHRAKK